MTLGRLLITAVLAAFPATAEEPARGEALARELRIDIALRNEAFARDPANIADKEWVKRKLAHMFLVDQDFRFKLIAVRKQAADDVERKSLESQLIPVMLDMDRDHTAEMKALLQRYRWFTISDFGAETDNNAWILIQHADRDVEFQKHVLSVLEALYPKGETNPRNYAYLVDRVARNENRPQRFATQGTCTAPGTWEPFPTEKPDQVDDMRRSVGLEPLSEYKKLVAQQCP
ncbi:MAG: DUF6624 domain-containing protein [Rhodospirillaceae bacterium]|nr:DUF6624 domain-containing protein [Rhodospirillaceae bacterium]